MNALSSSILFAQTAIPTVTTSPTASPTTAVASVTPSERWRITLDGAFWFWTAGLVIALIVAFAVGTTRKSGSDNWLTKLFSDFTNALAYVVIVLAFGGILGLSCAVLHAKNDLETAKYVFAAVLPLLGTWVGTVLAHYFQKENLNAATQSITTLVSKVAGNEKLQSVPVKNVMIRPEKIDTLPDTLLNQKDETIKLSELVTHLREGIKKDRLPIFKDNKKIGPAARVLHRSIVEKFVSQKSFEPNPSKAAADLTLADLMADSQLGAVVRGSFALIKKDATLADAKAEMDKASAALGGIGNCYDVFVTESGKPDEDVIGWITNDIINDNAKV